MAGKKNNNNNDEPDENEFREPTQAERRLQEQIERDKAQQQLGQAKNAQMYIINMLCGRKEIDIGLIAHNADLVEQQFGSDGYFDQHKVSAKSIAQAMEANKDRDLAKDAVHILSRRLQELIFAENAKEHKEHERTQRWRQGLEDHDKREGGMGGRG